MPLKLKFLRLQRSMTLEQLSAKSGLTRSYLSKLERGLSVPSIGSAIKISTALGVSLDQMYGQTDDRDPISIIRSTNGKPGDPTMHLSLVAGTDPGRIMCAFIIRPTETAQRGRMMSEHAGEEILFVLTGRIELVIGKRKEVLKPGDCVQFDSTIPHKLVALSNKPASALVVIAANGGSHP
jgi:transcriptional regulator with XRE-family HTH domain